MTTDTDRIQVEFMDTVYRAADRDDVDYYVDLATSTEGPVLELGCGTGRIYLELLNGGVDADGIDLSTDSLALLRERATANGLEPTVWEADMTDFITDREYGLFFCPFNAIQEVPMDRQQALFESAYDALAPNGTFVFDTFVPDFEYIAETWGEWQQRTIEFNGEEVEYHTRTRMDNEVTQTYISEKKAITQDGEQLFFFEGQAMLLPYHVIELLAKLSPFESWDVYGNYTDEELADGHSAQVWHLDRTAK